MNMDNTDTSSDIKVFIVDDHPLVRNSLLDLFAATPGLCTCGEAESCDEALKKIPAARPDLVIVDLGLRGSNGFDLLRSLKKCHPGIRPLVFSMHEESRYALRAIKEGAQGYVMKTVSPEAVLDAVFRVGRGKLVVSEPVQQQLLQDTADSRPGPERPDRILSSREWQVFECLGHGLTTKAIAGQLGISEKTAGSYCERIKTKLGKPRLREISQMAHDWLQDNAL